MKIHTDELTTTEIRSCEPAGCSLVVCEPSEFGSRSHERAYEVRLSGSTKNNMRNLPFKSATYDEWGWFLAALFALDPDMKAGIYKSRDDFEIKTEGNFYCTPAA